MAIDVSISNEIPCLFEDFASTFPDESPSHEEPSSRSLSEHRDEAKGDVYYATRQLAIEDVLPEDFDVAAKPRNKGDQLLQRDYLIDVGTKETVYHRRTARHASTVQGGRYRVVVLSKSTRHSHMIRIRRTFCPAVCLVKQEYQRRPPDGAALSRHSCFMRGPHLPSTILGTSGGSARSAAHAILLLEQVFTLVFVALGELIHIHSADLRSWFYVFPTRLFIKTGTDLLSSLQMKIQKILSIIRDCFPHGDQYQAVVTYITDPTQTPNIKVKITILRYLMSLLRAMDSGDLLVNTPETHSMVAKIFSWIRDQKSPELKKMGTSLSWKRGPARQVKPICEVAPCMMLDDVLKHNERPLLWAVEELTDALRSGNPGEPRTIFRHDMDGNYKEDRFIHSRDQTNAYRFHHGHITDAFIDYSHHVDATHSSGWATPFHCVGFQALEHGAVRPASKRGTANIQQSAGHSGSVSGQPWSLFGASAWLLPATSLTSLHCRKVESRNVRSFTCSKRSRALRTETNTELCCVWYTTFGIPSARSSCCCCLRRQWNIDACRAKRGTPLNGLLEAAVDALLDAHGGISGVSIKVSEYIDHGPHTL